jgi:outer membrane protein
MRCIREIQGAIGLILAVAFPTHLAAQSDSVTIDELAKTVIDSNPEIEAQRSAVRVIEARVRAAKGNYAPTLEANGLVQRRQLDIKNGAPGDTTFTAGQASVDARWRMFDGFRTDNSVDVAEAELDSGRAALEATITEVLFELVTRSANVQRDRKVQVYAEQQFDAISEQLKATSRRLEFGDATRTDENQAQARLATSSAGVLAAQEELSVSTAEFEEIARRPAESVPALPRLAMMPGSLEEARQIALAENPRIRAAKANAEAARQGIDFAKGALAPTVDAVAGYEYLTGGVANLFTGQLPQDRSALYGGLEVRVPIFQGGKEYAEIRRAKALKDQRLAQVEQTSRKVDQEITSGWARWKSALATIDAVERALVANEKAADGVRKEAIGGNRTLLDVLDAQNELLAARVALERSIRNEFVARVTVLALLGRLTPSLLPTP